MQFQEDKRAQGRSRSLAYQNSAVAAIEAERLRLEGKILEGKRVAEIAESRQDELDRTEAAKKYRQQGFTSKQSDTFTNREIKTNQVDRFLLSLSNSVGTVIASSLAKIGGGNVAGTEPSLQELEKARALLEEIRDDVKKTVTLEIEPGGGKREKAISDL